jgi:hypothetical protein
MGYNNVDAIMLSTVRTMLKLTFKDKHGRANTTEKK